jgi:hypothetical protein
MAGYDLVWANDFRAMTRFPGGPTAYDFVGEPELSGRFPRLWESGANLGPLLDWRVAPSCPRA